MKKMFRKMRTGALSPVWRMAAFVLSMLIVFSTTYALISPAITLSESAAEESAGIYLEDDGGEDWDDGGDWDDGEDGYDAEAEAAAQAEEEARLAAEAEAAAQAEEEARLAAEAEAAAQAEEDEDLTEAGADTSEDETEDGIVTEDDQNGTPEPSGEAVPSDQPAVTNSEIPEDGAAAESNAEQGPVITEEYLPEDQIAPDGRYIIVRVWDDGNYYAMNSDGFAVPVQYDVETNTAYCEDETQDLVWIKEGYLLHNTAGDVVYLGEESVSGTVVYETGSPVSIAKLEEGVNTSSIYRTVVTDGVPTYYALVMSEDGTYFTTIAIDTVPVNRTILAKEKEAEEDDDLVLGTDAETESSVESVAEPVLTESATESVAEPVAIAYAEGTRDVEVEGADYMIHVTFGLDACIPENAVFKAVSLDKETEYDLYAEKAIDAVAEDDEKIKENSSALGVFDLTIYDEYGNVVQPAAPIGVSVDFGKELNEKTTVNAVHFPESGELGETSENVVEDTADKNADKKDAGDAPEPDVIEAVNADGAVNFEADSFSVYVIVGTETITTKVITASGETYEISVTYGADAEVPNGASLKAEEILEGGEEYESYYEKTLMVLQEQATDENYLAGLDFARFFDVTIYDSEGTKIEPKAPVEVKITYVDPLEVADHTELKVVHFADQGTEIIDIDNDEQSVSEIVYEQNGFSIIGTVGATDAYGWPQGNDNPYVVILQSGDSYYAVAHDGTLKEVHYLNETVSFMGQGTTTLDYLDDYLWDYTVVSSTRHTATLSTSGEDTPAYIDPVYGVLPGNPDTLISPAQRTLYINNGQIYATYYGTRYTLSAEGGELNRTTVDASDASPILFAPRSSFMANSSESEDYDYIDIETLIEEWKRQMTQDLVVDKTAEVVDYENRIYEVDLAASSGYHLVTPALALEFVVDASRSMYFPENLYEHATYSTLPEMKNWITRNGDSSQTYYVITDPNNKATNYTIYYNTSLQGWYVVDAAYHHAPDGVNQDGTALNQWSRDEEYDGKIYISDEKVEGQPWCRLDYMKLAVSAAARVLFAIDPSAQIGLVSFNAEDHAYGPFTQTGTEQYSEGDVQALINALNNISLAGGTQHDRGLNRAVTEFTNKFHQITNCQAAVVLITDGAPNGTTWQNIRTAANSVKSMTNAYNQNTRLFTLGLSLEHIGNNKQELANIATDASHAFNAEKSSEVVSFLTKIIEGLVVDANLKGNVTDVIDAAFYPVNPNTGMPLESGTWITLEGRVTTQGAEDAAGKVIKEGNTWKVEWNDQLITWPDSNTGKHGWNGRIYLKAQEDFLGGNDINTNASGSQVEAIEYINPRTQEHVVISSDDAEKIKEFDTPYVNVDELAINENSTEWTVYLGESVDPRTELEELLDLVQIYEVVKEDGNLVYTYTPGSTTNPTKKATTGVAIDLDEFLGALTEDDWDALIAGDPIETEYKAYGHTPGSLWVTLTQAVATDEDDLTPSPHNTAVVGEKVEKYTLTVTYEPYDASVADYHTGNNITGSYGEDTDEMVSENIHIINVFAKGMQITKTDQGFVKELTGAKFVLYRTARNGDDQSKVTPIDGATGNYYPVAELDLSSIASGTINPVEKLAEGERYYLVETQAPTGYYPLDHPVPVTLEITNTYVPKPGDQSQQTKPTSGIYDWTQTAALTVDTSGGVKRTDADNTTDLTHTAVIPDSENTILYFRIANSTGYELPNTGGPGTRLFTILGSILILGAGVLLWRRRRLI